MNITSGIIEVDLHGKTVEEAIKAARQAIAKAGSSVYTIRLIHGFNGGTRIKSAVAEEFGYGLEPKVKRVKPGPNQGITDLILREL